MWNSFKTDEDLSITASIINFAGGGGDQIHAYVAQPNSSEARPGIVLVHHLPGWDEFYQEFAERLARHGYTVICPDLYCRFGHGLPDDITAKVRADGGVPDDSVVADCEAARSWLKSQPSSNGKVGIIGTCSGGRHTFLAAARLGGFDAVADLWGGGVVASADKLTPAQPVAPLEYAKDLDAPLLGLFGNDDQSPSPEDVNTLEAELKLHGKDYDFHRYDGAGHGFFYYHKAMYRVDQAMDGWEKVLNFFDQHLKN